MGTPVAVTYSNIFLYGLETEVLKTLRPQFFTRYIDDVFAIFPDATSAQTFVDEFNSLVPSIKFEAVTIGTTGVMLDLEFDFIPHPSLPSSLTIKHKIYQKPINIYQYIPTLSNHKSSLFHNFILQELKRYRISCTDDTDYHNIATQFRIRLCSRGYPTTIYDKAFILVPSRHVLMLPLLTRLPSRSTPKVKQPLIILSVPDLDPPVKWSKLLAPPFSLTNTSAYQDVYQSSKLLIGTKNPPSIGSYLIRSLYIDPDSA